MEIGITGNIASGKSMAASILKEIIGAAIVDADSLSHYILATNPDIQRMVSLEFGADVLDERNNIDRKKLSHVVFSNLEKLNRLNKIFYPYLTYEVKMEILKAKNIFNHIILDAALIVEWGMQKDLDVLIFITASRDIRLRRLIENRRLFEEDAEKMIESQTQEEYKLGFADFIVKNEGQPEQLREEMEKIANKLI